MMPSFIIKKWGEMMKTQVLNKEGLSTYDQEIKDYIKSQGMGVTLEEVQALIDASDKNTTYTLTKNENNEITKENITTALGYIPYTPTEVDNKIDDLDSCIITNDDIDSIFSENS